MREIGAKAFAGRQGLKELRLGTGIKSIEKAAFAECVSLKSVAIPDSVEIVGNEAFKACDYLVKLRLEEGVKRIEKDAFANCRSLKIVDIPDSVEVVDEKDLPVFRFARNRRRGLFASPSSTNESLKYLEWEIAWNGARITDCDTNFKGALEIPTLIGGIEVVEICEHAFQYCYQITSVVIPDSVKHVVADAYCDGAFDGVTVFAERTLKRLVEEYRLKAPRYQE